MDVEVVFVFNKLINKGNNYYLVKNTRKYCEWFRVEFDIEGRYNPHNFNELVDCMKEYFNKSKHIYYEKKILETRINNTSGNVPLSQFLSNLLTICAIFIASVLSLVTAMNYGNDFNKNNNLLSWFNYIWIPIILLVLISLTIYGVDIKLSKNLKKSYNHLCLDIIKEVEAEKARLKEEADKKELFEKMEQCINNKNKLGDVLPVFAEIAAGAIGIKNNESNIKKLIKIFKKTSK